MPAPPIYISVAYQRDGTGIARILSDALWGVGLPAQIGCLSPRIP